MFNPERNVIDKTKNVIDELVGLSEAEVKNKLAVFLGSKIDSAEFEDVQEFSFNNKIISVDFGLRAHKFGNGENSQMAVQVEDGENCYATSWDELSREDRAEILARIVR